MGNLTIFLAGMSQYEILVFIALDSTHDFLINDINHTLMTVPEGCSPRSGHELRNLGLSASVKIQIDVSSILRKRGFRISSVSTILLLSNYML